MIDEFLNYNKKFVDEKLYEKYRTSKYPDKKTAIISCMDTRLTELLPAALGIKNGDVKMIKNAGGMIIHPFGSAVRSLLIAIFELGVTDVMIIGHTDCGVQHVNKDEMIKHMISHGISEEKIEMAHFCGIDFDKWLAGFESVEQSVRESVDLVVRHPLIPSDINVYGYVMDSETGELNEITKFIRMKK